MLISTLKEKFAFASTPQERIDVIRQYTVPESRDWYYYRGLVILQELYMLLMSKLTTEEGLLIRTPDPREAQLLNDMTTHLSKCKPVYYSIYSTLEARFKLLSYPVNSAESIEYIQRELQIHTSSNDAVHFPTPTARGPESLYPTRFDESLLDLRTIIINANSYGAVLNPVLIPTFGNDDCVETLLKIPQRRDDLVRLVADMIRSQKSPDLHMLTLEQLEELRDLVPGVVEKQGLQYVNIFLQKLVPSRDVEVGEGWDFERILRFADTLKEHHVLKKTILCYLLLDHVIKRRFDQWKFFEKFYRADMDAQSTDDDTDIPGLDSNLPETFYSLLRQEFIIGALRQNGAVVHDKLKRLPRYLTELKSLHARLILTSGSRTDTGDALDWAKKALGQDAVDKLATEVELRFPFAALERENVRRPQLLPSDSIQLTVRIKNIKQITVRAYQMDLFQYWHRQKSNILNVKDIKLDGLCPNWEKDFDMGHLSPLERFDMALDLNDPRVFGGRGIWVIDVVGGRESCRAIVQKGRLRHLVKDTSAGHLFCILDESNLPVKAKLWFENQFYEADEKNNILIPYGSYTQNGARALVISEDNGYCEPILFTRKSESYDLKATFFVHPESLVANKQTKVTVTIDLSIYDQAVSLALLEPLSLTVIARNVRDIKSTFAKENIPVPTIRNEPVELEFTVPSSLASLDFVMKTKARTTSTKQPFQELEASDSLQFKTVTNSITSAYLCVLENGDYAIQILCKNGEVRPDAMVHLHLDHAMVKTDFSVKLQTDQNGFVHLGKLRNVTSVHITVPLKKSWNLLPSHTESSLPSTLYYPANTPFKLPYAAGVNRKCTLFQTGSSGTILHDFSDMLEPTDEVVEVQGLPVGRYAFYLALRGGTTYFGVQMIELMILDSTPKNDSNPHWSGWLLDRQVFAQSTGRVIQNPLTIKDLKFTDGMVIVDLNHASPSNTVAFLSLSAFVPEPLVNPASRFIANIPAPNRLSCGLDTYATFLEGRKLSQEFEYVLNRMRAEKWVGSTLPKPSMVVYPKSNKVTTAKARYLEGEEPHTKQTAMENAFGGARMRKMGAKSFWAPVDVEHKGVWNDIGFLHHQCPVLVAVPDRHGRIAVRRSDLGDGNILHLVVCQGKQTLVKQVALEGSNKAIKRLDLSHSGHDPKTAYVRSKSIANLRDPSKPLELDVAQHEWEIVGSLEKMFDHFCTIAKVSLEDFQFLNTWHSMSLAQKFKKHQEMVCHELNLWLKFKDTGFFDAHVKPFIKSKFQKAFMDYYLLDEDLTAYATDICLYGTLSTIEKALLAKRVPELLPVTLKEFKGVYQPPSEKNADLQFETILAGSVLQSSAYNNDSYVDEAEESDDDMGFALYDGAPARCCAAVPELQEYTEVVEESGKAIQHPDDEADVEDDTSRFDDEKVLRNELYLRQVKQPYKFVEATREWEEKGYYNDKASMAPVNEFWIDYLQSGAGPFLSGNFIYAHADLTEVLAVLALTDLPFSISAQVNQEVDIARNKMVIVPKTPCLVYYRALQAAKVPAPSNPTILLGQGFFVRNDVSGEDDLEMIDPSDLQPSVDYGWNLSISNISPACCTAEVTLQVPLGSIPTGTTDYIQSHTIQIKPYSTWRKVVGSFYFANSGEYDHAPVTVSKGSVLYGQTNPVHITVKKKENLGYLLSSSAPVSWAALTSSYNGVPDTDVLDYLEHRADLQKIDLKLLDWRMRRPAFAKHVIRILRGRMFFSRELWEYGFQHRFSDAIREYLLNAGQGLFRKCGGTIETPLVSNTVINKPVKVLDYYTLISARVHPLIGNQTEIFDEDFFGQYDVFLDYLVLVQSPSCQDLIMQTIYLILQDRIGEAHQAFRRLQASADKSATSSIQVDYLRAYLETRVKADLSHADMATLDLGRIRAIVLKYKSAENERWRKMFDSLGEFLDEVERPLVTAAGEGQTRSTVQQEPTLGFEVDTRAGQLTLIYANVTDVQIRYYKMDVELMFSMNPFLVSSIRDGKSRHRSSLSAQYEWIKPSVVEDVKLPTGENDQQQQDVEDDSFEIIGGGQLLGHEMIHQVDIPSELLHQNCVIQVRTSAGLERQKAYFSHSLIVQPVETHGMIRVACSIKDQNKRTLAGAYVKVYAKLRDGDVQFWKDGYTGLNGLFDYVSVTNGNGLLSRDKDCNENYLETLITDRVERFSLLVSSSQHGALVEEVLPPRC